MFETDEKIKQRYRNAVNNAQGKHFEEYIKKGCMHYRIHKKAYIEKMPEPFRVTKKYPDGTFTGRFTANAMPDFIGTLSDGKAICFEAKYTRTEKLSRNILTQTQMDVLEEYSKAGAVAAICAGIKEQFFFIPWPIWRDMKNIYKRQYLKADDIKEYQVRFTGAILFLDYMERGR